MTYETKSVTVIWSMFALVILFICCVVCCVGWCHSDHSGVAIKTPDSKVACNIYRETAAWRDTYNAALGGCIAAHQGEYLIECPKTAMQMAIKIWGGCP